MSPEEARARFAAASVARLATIEPDGRPHLVPITFAVDGERIVTAIDAKPKRGTALRRLANIAADPRVSVLVDHYEADWARLWWARADGTATVLHAGDDFDRALHLLRDRYAQYATVELTGPVIVIVVERWSGWRAEPG